MISKGIETFLDYLRETEQQYRMALAGEQEANDATQDILHVLELEEHDAAGYARLAETLREIRKARRTAKDRISQALPVVEWAEENRQIIKGLERLLGAVRKEEKRAEGRIYTPKTTATAGTSLQGGERMSEWIRVQERLPKPFTDVLAYHAKGEISITWINSVGDWMYENAYGRATHWMPLPEMPMGEDL